ncbi:PIN-like domain-containing protein, partial [Amycolatopsis lurida]|uniref:PIN-like domain-containing protein n=1 Tax=Amycolatopsis lurida TaxID=31959 RepID=UPI00364D368D
GARDTNTDPILAMLLRLLDGRIGPAFSQEAMAKALKEAERRNQTRTPPGYQDREKDDNRSAGDYLVWEQTLVEAERRKVDVLFVTGDVKEDWWRRVQNLPVGPRVELVDELRDRTGRRLLMAQPQDLLRIAGNLLDIVVRPSSVEEIQDSGRAEAGATSTRQDRIRLYLESALGTGLPAGMVLNSRGANELSGWDIVIDGSDRQRVLIWFYDPLRPFNDIATDSVRSTATAMVRGARRRFLGEESWLVCVADLTTLARRMDVERREPWEHNPEKHSASARAAAEFAPYLRNITEAGFDHVDHVIDTETDNLARLDSVADKVREYLARSARP